MNLAKFFGIESSPDRTDTTPTKVVPTTSAAARERYRDALAARRPLELAVEEAVAARARAAQMIAALQDAEAEAAEVEAQVSAATRAWAEAGARADAPAVPQAVLDKLDRTRRAALEAKFKAAGATAALHRLADNERDARQQLVSADGAIKEARGCAQVAMIDEKRGERFARALRKWLVDDVLSLAAILRPSYAYGPFNGRQAHREVVEMLLRCGIRVPSDDEIQKRSAQAHTPEMQALQRFGHAWIELYIPADGDLKPQIAKWVELSQRLRTDPEATK